MGRLPNLLRLGSKLVLEILPSIAATVIGGYLLTQLHFSRTPEAPPAAAVAASGGGTPAAGGGAPRTPARAKGGAKNPAGPRRRPAKAGDDRERAGQRAPAHRDGID